MVIYLSIIHVVYLIFGHTQRCIQPHRRTPASFRRLTLLEMPIWKNRSFSVSFKGKHKTRYYRLYEIIFITMLYTLRNIITIPSLCIYVNYILQYTWIYYIYMYHIYVYSVYTVFRVAFWIHLFTRYVDKGWTIPPTTYLQQVSWHGGVLFGHCHGGHQGSRSNKESRVEKGDFNV